MEFNFRSVDKRPPTNIAPPDPIPNTRAMIERQLEKDGIKEEIIAGEILRRRIAEAEIRRELDPRLRLLEAEVRRELNLEREIALRRSGQGLGPLDPFNVTDARFPPFASPAPAALNQTSSFPPRLTGAAAAAADFKLSSPPPRPSELNNNILVAKPDLNLSGVKRKTQPACGDGELPPFGLKKKPKEEWSCALCQVNATTQKGLNHHLKGKKHKAREAGLKAPKRLNAPLTKLQAKELLIWKRTTLSEPKEANGISTLPKLDAEEIKKPLEHETSDGLGDRMQDTCPSKDTAEEPSMQEVQCLEDLNNKEEIKSNKNFKFWCGRCKIGTFSPKVMLDHVSGKKHVFSAQGLTRNDVPVASFTTSLEAIKEAEGPDAAKKADEKIPAETCRASPGANADLIKGEHRKIPTAGLNAAAAEEVDVKIPAPTPI